MYVCRIFLCALKNHYKVYNKYTGTFFVFIMLLTLLRDLSGLLDIFHVTVIVTVALVVGPVFCLGRFKFDQLIQELIEE